jgi:pyruvate/2-oxoglutarate/acetoin dehydrogenase E1 component
MTFATAANLALKHELSARDNMLVYGEDIAIPGGVFGVTKGLQTQFGTRVFDTPISESAILGSAIGAAMMGMRPVVEIMWADFMFVAFDQIINQAANVRYLSRAEVTAPLTIRTQQGMSAGACAQHSQSVEAMLLHIPGISVAMPSNPQDAYDILRTAIALDDPTVVIENRTLYHGVKSAVDVEKKRDDPFSAEIVRKGSDITVLSWGAMVNEVRDATDILQSRGIDVELIDARWLSPFDYSTVCASVKRTGRLAVVHEATRTGGFASEVILSVQERGAPLTHVPLRITTPDVRVPAAPSLMADLRPSASSIARSITQYLEAIRP